LLARGCAGNRFAQDTWEQNLSQGIGLQRLSAARGDYHWGVETRAFGTADEAAGSAAAMLADGERLSRLWRYVFAQLLDGYTSVLRHEGTAAAARMWSAVPRATGDGRVDAAFASMAEYLARQDSWTVPAWAALPEREAWPWWFVTDLRGLHPQALVESYSSFRRRGVFITSGALQRA
jgi:hypothetical protein